MNRLRPGALLAATCGLFSIFLLGCPGTLDPGVVAGGMGGSGGNDNCQVQLLTTRCAICHVMTGGSAGLDLQSANPGPAMIGKMSMNSAGGDIACQGQVLLMAGSNPAAGLFIDKIVNPTPCGLPMPIGGNPLTAAEKTCLTDWATTITTMTAAAPAGEEHP